MRSPTGEQFLLSRATPNGAATAVITELAASLRELRIGGVDLTQPYPEGSPTPLGTGIVLVPWPNRVADGRWRHEGTMLQLDITEPVRNNAIHGLLRTAAYHLLDRGEEFVALGATVFPQHGYPFLLETTVEYRLVDDGIAVTHGIRNDSASAAPVAVGTHPFLRIGELPVEELTLTVHAATRFPVDERLNVSPEVPVVGDYDLRAGRRVGELALDDAFGQLTPVDRVTAKLSAADGREVALWQDENFPYVQVFTTDAYPTESGPVHAIAIEPMTAPADALNSGQSLRWLEPGEEWTVRWGIRYTP